MQGWLTKYLELEQENELLHDMVRNISAERNIYRTENQQLLDEIARLRREVGDKK